MSIFEISFSVGDVLFVFIYIIYTENVWFRRSVVDKNLQYLK